MVIAIVCCDIKWGIGKENKLLAKIPDDMRYFQNTTNEKIVVMGRKTWESLPIKPLPNRINVIITSQKINNMDQCSFVNYEFAEALIKNKNSQTRDIVIIGGGQIYKAFLKYCDEVYVTKVYKEFDADTWFPDIDKMNMWELYEKSDIKEYDGMQYQFIKYKRRDVL